MFQHEGIERSDRLNRILAGYLAFIGGWVNATGFVVLGTFTSHVTGNVARSALEFSSAHLQGGVVFALLAATFFAGAMVSNLVLESSRVTVMSRRYGVALALEAGLLSAFMLRSSAPSSEFFLCGAMGMQNSLVTRLSGAVVRTTHLTGVVTDLGIEAARWLRWWRRAPHATKPALEKSTLLATIGSTFGLGALCGSCLALYVGAASACVPMAALIAGVIYAFATPQR